MSGPLQERNFRWYYLAQLVNQAGSFMNGVALTFAVLKVSDSPSALGWVLAAHSIPMVIFLLAGGVIADRFGRKLIIQVSNLGAGLTQIALAVLVLEGHARLSQLIALSALNGLAAGASFPALASLVPQLVAREQLQQATALVSLQRNGLRMIGPAVAGAVVVTAGAGWALAFDGVTYLASAALLARVHLPPRSVREHQSSLVAELREGWSYVRGTTWLWVVILSFSVLNALWVGAFHTLGPVLAVRTSIGESGWGLILSAEAAGLLLTSLVFLRFRLERPLFWGMVAMALNALPMLALGVAPHLIIVMAAAFLTGAAGEVFGIGWALAMQEHVPEEMLTRAYSYDALGSYLAVPAGQIAFGPLGAAFGIQHTILVSGVLFVLISLLALSSHSVRSLQRVPASGGTASGEPSTDEPAASIAPP